MSTEDWSSIGAAPRMVSKRGLYYGLLRGGALNSFTILTDRGRGKVAVSGLSAVRIAGRPSAFRAFGWESG